MTDAALATVVAAAPGAAPGDQAAPPPRRLLPALAQAGPVLLGVGLLVVLWEAYKLVGPQDGGTVLGARLLPRAADSAMPHVWQVLSVLGEQEVRTPGSRSVGEAVLAASWFTLKAATAGCLLGAAVGLALAVAMQRLRVVEHALLPWVLLSQTVPLVALAPLVTGWGGNLALGPLHWQSWTSVVVVSAYLAFCPVAVGALRGLQSPAPASVELFCAYATSWWRTLLRLRLPASVPYLVPALRLAAASAVLGSIVAEISTGTRGGVGRLIVEYAQQATSAPARVYAAVLGAALLGLVASCLVTLLDVLVLRRTGRRA